MEMTGEQIVPAPRIVVWEALNDIGVLKECIPGCTSLERQNDGQLEGKSVLRVGPIKASFSGRVVISDVELERGYSISGEGQGGIAGFAKGGAKVQLEDFGSDTKLIYTAKADVGGKLAQLGSRLIDSTARQLAGKFFEKFAAVVEAKSKMLNKDE